MQVPQGEFPGDHDHDRADEYDNELLDPNWKDDKSDSCPPARAPDRWLPPPVFYSRAVPWLPQSLQEQQMAQVRGLFESTQQFI